MCMFCGESTIEDIMIIDKNSTRVFCPNCLEHMTWLDLIKFEEPPNISDDIEHTDGAICYISANKTYYLKSDALMRLVTHGLKPSEWKTLCNKYINNYKPYRHMLHGDFYDDNSNAFNLMYIDEFRHAMCNALHVPYSLIFEDSQTNSECKL